MYFAQALPTSIPGKSIYDTRRAISCFTWKLAPGLGYRPGSTELVKSTVCGLAFGKVTHRVTLLEKRKESLPKAATPIGSSQWTIFLYSRSY